MQIDAQNNAFDAVVNRSAKRGERKKGRQDGHNRHRLVGSNPFGFCILQQADE